MKNFFQLLKFAFFSASAGLIEIVAFTAFNEWFRWNYWAAYLTALVLSVLWNFTFNRKFTFRSNANVPLAMLLVACYYAVFTPASTILGDYLNGTIGWNEYLVTAINMILNFSTEFLYQKFVVFRKRPVLTSVGLDGLYLRPAKKADVAEILSLLPPVIEHMHGSGVDLWNEMYPACEYPDDQDERRLYVLELAGEVLGALTLNTTHGGQDAVLFSGGRPLYIERFFVAAPYMRQGIGKKAIALLQTAAAVKGYDCLRLFAVKNNEPAVEFYHACGFVTVPGSYTEQISDTFSLEEWGMEKFL